LALALADESVAVMGLLLRLEKTKRLFTTAQVL